MKPQWRDPGSVPGRTAVHLCPVLPFVPILGFGNLSPRTINAEILLRLREYASENFSH
jgi:hypothetical protein